ncbi:hypothetical protein BZG36_04199 [Bifiguratus adelaidae]|uniref:Sorting nexin-4 n=1 Tax=Bifiguratus adelaidae TaxID=1938954 RepID=A0A261XW30_9FUNG|nr:hypothetical protein BZG36_04199 [Bifiguratus adelaidae]
MEDDEFSNVQWDTEGNQRQHSSRDAPFGGDDLDPLSLSSSTHLHEANESGFYGNAFAPTFGQGDMHNEWSQAKNQDMANTYPSTTFAADKHGSDLSPEHNRGEMVSGLSDALQDTHIHHASTSNHDSAPASSSSAKNPNLDPSLPTLVEMTITVTDPQKEVEKTESTHISYLVTTTTQLDTFHNPQCSVRRRFQDFVWLHETLEQDFPACVVPPLPEKHRLEYVTGDRFGPEFVNKRRISLQRFLERISRHPILQRSEHLQAFLESPTFNSKAARASRKDQSALENIGDVLLNAFSKIKKPDERFIQMKDNLDKLEENLNMVEKLCNRIGKRTADLQQDYSEFASSIYGLAALETGITLPLNQFGDTVQQYSGAMKAMNSREEFEYFSEIHEYLAYCAAVKNVLKLRDQKQLDFEELSDYLQNTITEREKTLHSRGDRGINISGYITDKMNEVRGVEKERVRQEKLEKLNARVAELQSAVEQSNDVSNAFSTQVEKEFSIFQKSKTIELRDSLIAYTDSHVEFYEKGMELWSKIIPVLEGIEVNNE